MNARPGNSSAVRHERGFVLVGVVMFVLALTILGLSVFSLSSYEAQFLNRTLDQNRAFYAAQGGMERSRFVVAATGMLETAQTNLPAGVDSAIAKQWQAPDSVTSGPLEWGGDDIVIKVSAHVNGERTTLWGRYRPSQLDDYYKRLITCDTLRINPTINNGLNFNDPPPYLPPICRYTADVNGRVWTGYPDSTWKTMAKPPPLNGIRTDPVPTPAVASFIAAHPAPMPAYNLATNTYTLNGNSTAPTFFGFPSLPVNLPFTLFNNLGSPTIHVRGRCVWMFREGVYFYNRLRIVDDGDNACLVIIGGQSGFNAFGERAGVWFFGSLDCPDVPLILVSDGRVVIEHFNNPTSNSDTEYLSIFAKSVQFSGPWLNQGGPARYLHLNHPMNAPEDADDGLIDWLSERGALPNATAATGTELTLRPGTWTELTP